MPSVNGGPSVSSNINTSAALSASTTDGVVASVVLKENDTTSALANTQRIQSALNAGGTVYVYSAGVAYINSALVHGDNTEMILLSGTTIRQATGVNGNLWQTASYSRPWQTATPTWSAGSAVNVQWTNHGQSVGNYVHLDNASSASSEQSKFMGVFRVDAVVDANNITINTRRAPTVAPSGTWRIRQATVNAFVRGGVWDYNQDNNAGGTGQAKMGLMFVSCANSGYDSIRVVNCPKYAVLACGNHRGSFRRLTVENTGSSAISDGIKIYGPDFGSVVDGLLGVTGDDSCSIQPKEAAAFSQYQPAYGDCIGTSARNIETDTLNAGTSSAVIYASTNEMAMGIVIDGVRGRPAGIPVRIQPGDNYTNAQLGSAYVRGICSESSSIDIQVGGGTSASMVAGTIVIENCDHNTRDYTQGFAKLNSNLTANLVTFRDCVTDLDSLASPTWPSSGASPFIQVDGVVNVLTTDNCMMSSKSGGGRFIQTSATATIRRINIRGGQIIGSKGINVSAAGGGTPDYYFDGVDMNLTYGVDTPSACNVFASGCTLNGATKVVNNQGAGAVTLHYGSITLNGTSALTNGTVTATPY